MYVYLVIIYVCMFYGVVIPNKPITNVFKVL